MPQPQTTITTLATPTLREREIRQLIAHEVSMQPTKMTVFEVCFLAKMLAEEEEDIVKVDARFKAMDITAAVVGFMAARMIATDTVLQAAAGVRGAPLREACTCPLTRRQPETDPSGGIRDARCGRLIGATATVVKP
jgi:hypothetical protein